MTSRSSSLQEPSICPLGMLRSSVRLLPSSPGVLYKMKNLLWGYHAPKQVLPNPPAMLYPNRPPLSFPFAEFSEFRRLSLVIVLEHLTPGMLKDLVDIVPLRKVTIQHAANEIDALLTDGVRYSKVAIHNLVNAVEWVLLIDDGVE